MNAKLIRLVRRRAGQRCEYCHLPRLETYFAFEIDHIIAKKHGGRTAAANLAFACMFCNGYKGSNVAGVEPRTGKVVRLFHPRRDRWDRHFRWRRATLVGRTPVGRTTIAVLRMNKSEAMQVRHFLIDAGLFPLP